MDNGAPADEAAVADLVEQARAGDAAAFGALYDHFIARLYRFVFYRVHSTQEAEDLTEEIFMKVWRGLPKYSPGQIPFAAWLFRVARNHLIDYHRTSHVTEPLDSHRVAGLEPEETALRTVQADEVRKLLSKLTEDQRQVLQLRFFEDLDTSEIARLTARAEGAVRALQMRGLAALRRAMEGQEIHAS